MKAIVAVDKLWGIGKDGDLLFHIKEDMKFFKEMTIGKVVVMGRKTFESLPNKQPLKDRINIVITSNKSYKNSDNLIFVDIDSINAELEKYNNDDIFIIGGGSIYEYFCSHCNEIYITRIWKESDADTYFPSEILYTRFVLKDIINRGKTEDNIIWRIEKWKQIPYDNLKSIIIPSDDLETIIKSFKINKSLTEICAASIKSEYDKQRYMESVMEYQFMEDKFASMRSELFDFIPPHKKTNK